MSLMSYQMPNNIIRAQNACGGADRYGLAIKQKPIYHLDEQKNSYNTLRRRSELNEILCATNVLLNISLKYQSLSPCHTRQTLDPNSQIRSNTHTYTHCDCDRRTVDLIRSLGLRA